MADYNSGLPIRTEADGADERVHVKVVDGVTPAQRMTVDSDLNAHAEVHGDSPAGVDKVLRLSELGAITPDGAYDAANNTKPGNVGVIVSSRSATPGDATQTVRPTGIQNSTVWALDIALHDESGVAFSETNPLPVAISDSEGTEVNDYKATTNTAAAATDNHDYTVTALKTLKLTQIEGAASGKAKAEVQIESGVATGVFASKWVMFNSTANPMMSLAIKESPAIAAGVRVRVIMSNLDNQAQNLYSTISGHEV